MADFLEDLWFYFVVLFLLACLIYYYWPIFIVAALVGVAIYFAWRDSCATTKREREAAYKSAVGELSMPSTKDLLDSVLKTYDVPPERLKPIADIYEAARRSIYSTWNRKFHNLSFNLRQPSLDSPPTGWYVKLWNLHFNRDKTSSDRSFTDESFSKVVGDAMELKRQAMEVYRHCSLLGSHVGILYVYSHLSELDYLSYRYEDVSYLQSFEQSRDWSGRFETGVHNYVVAVSSADIYKWADFNGFFNGGKLDIPQDTRFEHQFVLAPSGSGKSTLLQTQIVADFDKVARGECSIIVLDSKNQKDSLVPSLAHLKVFAPGGALEGRLILLEPEAAYPLELNIFDVGDIGGDIEQQAVARSEIRNTILSCVAGTNDGQDTMLRHLVTFCMEIPDATIDTLMELLTPAGFKEHEKFLSRVKSKQTRDYFNTTFKQDTRKPTMEAVQSRLRIAMSEPGFADMFMTKNNRFRLLEHMEKGRVILINTKIQLLGEFGCEMFGRFFLAQLLNASYYRDSTSIPVFCYVDECQDYIARDEAISKALDKIRSRRIGFIFATQRMAEITSPRVKDALMNVAIRFIATADQPRKGNFQCWVKGQTTTDEPLDVQVPKDVLESMDRMSAREYQAIKTEMRKRYSAGGDPVVDTRPPSVILASQAPIIMDLWPKLEAAVIAAGGYKWVEQRNQTVKRLDFKKLFLRNILSQSQMRRLNVLRHERNMANHTPPVPIFNFRRWTTDMEMFIEILGKYPEDEGTTSASDSF